MKRLYNTRILQFSLMLIAGIFLGWLVFKGENVQEHAHEITAEQETRWTCAMHPQIRQNEPGQCPICGMDLIPFSSTGAGTGEESPFVHTMSPEAVALANVQTTTVKYTAPEHKVILTGKIAVNEQKLAMITANYSGRIERLYVDFTGQAVSKGQRLASIYSPELVTAQQELIEAAKTKDISPALYNAVREKLRLWKITEAQINAIETRQQVKTEFTVYSNTAGIVLNRRVAEGDYVARGNVLFEVADLSNVWILLDAYEIDLPWLKIGSKVNFTVASNPGKEYTSTITFIDPVINPQTRTLTIRAEAPNPQLELKPETFVKAEITTSLPKLENTLVIPSSAVLWTGKRSIVYIKVPDAQFPAFEMREITLGPRTGDLYLIQSGIEEGEEIVVNGVFAIDAAAQLSGNYSMMNPEGGAGGGSMPGMEMRGKTYIKAKQKPTAEFVEGEGYDFREQTPDAFRKQLDASIAAYLGLKDGLVAGNRKATAKYSTALYEALQEVNGNLLKGDAKTFWQEKKSFLLEHAKLCKEAPTIEGKRENFIFLSEPMIKLLIAFGPGNEKLYVDYCPMANNNKGAYWLSKTKKIRNPFMPETMLSCGEIKKEILANK